MSLWLAKVRARLDVLVCQATGADDREARSLHECTHSELERARERAADVPATWLRTRLGLSATEEEVLWLLIACEISEPVRAQVFALVGGRELDPSVSAVQRIVYGAEPSLTAWRELGPGGKLAELALVVRTDDGDVRTPEYRQTLRAASRVRGLALGDPGLAAELAGVARLVSGALPLAAVVAPAGVIERVAAQVRKPRAFVLVTGTPGAGRATLLRAAAHAAAQRVVEIEGRALAPSAGELEPQLREIAREAQLLGATILVSNLDAMAQGEGADARLRMIEQRLGASTQPLLATARQRPLGLRGSRPVVVVEIGAVTGAQRVDLWTRVIPGCSSSDAEHLASYYPLAPAVIDAVGQALQVRIDGEITEPELRETIFSVVDDRLSGLATRIEVTQTWDDLVLPQDQLDTVSELLARVRERRRVYEQWGFASKLGKGLGVAALLSGPPGTGKTMAASLIAKDLGLALYRVDLAQMVSKWIGETEKNLAAVFDAAESGHAVLLFDEADSLFGKRTEVKSSNDRYANLEVNYLLQRLETFTGICLLTTNHEHAIDEAFRRRLAFHLRFPVPDQSERAQLWRAMIPGDAPLAPASDFEALAERLELPGGLIRNAALRAAFLAADAGSPITMDHLWHAAVMEYEASGKIAPRGGTSLC